MKCYANYLRLTFGSGGNDFGRVDFDESGVIKRLPEMMADASFNAENSLHSEENVRQGNERGLKENRKGEIASWCLQVPSDLFGGGSEIENAVVQSGITIDRAHVLRSFWPLQIVDLNLGTTTN